MKTVDPTEDNIQDIRDTLDRLDDCDHGQTPLVMFLHHMLEAPRGRQIRDTLCNIFDGTYPQPVAMMYDPDMKILLAFTAICGLLAAITQSGAAILGLLAGIFIAGFIGIVKLAQGVAEAGVSADREAMLARGMSPGEAEIIAQLRQQRRENF